MTDKVKQDLFQFFLKHKIILPVTTKKMPFKYCKVKLNFLYDIYLRYGIKQKMLIVTRVCTCVKYSKLSVFITEGSSCVYYTQSSIYFQIVLRCSLRIVYIILIIYYKNNVSYEHKTMCKYTVSSSIAGVCAKLICCDQTNFLFKLFFN